MKKYIHIAFAFLFTACSSTEIVQKVREIGILGGQPSPIEEVSGKGTLPEKTKESLETKVQPEKEVVKIQELNETKVREIIDAVRMNVKQGSKKRLYSERKYRLRSRKVCYDSNRGRNSRLKIVTSSSKNFFNFKEGGDADCFPKYVPSSLFNHLEK